MCEGESRGAALGNWRRTARHNCANCADLCILGARRAECKIGQTNPNCLFRINELIFRDARIFGQYHRGRLAGDQSVFGLHPVILCEIVWHRKYAGAASPDLIIRVGRKCLGPAVARTH